MSPERVMLSKIVIFAIGGHGLIATFGIVLLVARGQEVPPTLAGISMGAICALSSFLVNTGSNANGTHRPHQEGHKLWQSDSTKGPPGA